MGKHKLKHLLLGGPTSPSAGDGSGYNPSPSKSPLQLQTTVSPVSGQSSESDLRRPSPSTSSRHPSPISPSQTTDESESRFSPNAHSRTVAHMPGRLPNGLLAPRGSVAALAGMTSGLALAARSVHMNTGSASPIPETAVINEPPEDLEELPWQENEIPPELGLIRDDLPEILRNVLHDSFDEHQAIRESVLQSKAALADIARNDDEASSTAAESSFATSSTSTPDKGRSTSSLSAPLGSEVFESDTEGDSHLKPEFAANPRTSRNTQFIFQTEAVPEQYMTGLERRFLEGKMRAKKSKRLFKLISNEFSAKRRSRGELSPGLPKIGSAMCECVSCFDEVPQKKAVLLPCTHTYCAPCFEQLITTSIQHEISFPPKCCLTEVPKKIIRDNLPPVTCSRFDEKALEYAVPIGSRYYCVSPRCGKWIDTRHATRSNGAMQCPHCANSLCMLCRGPQHPANEECPQDSALNRTLEQAERAGWRRCHRCRILVERNSGCRHMTCTCGAQFW